jgi:hypothetical protein
MGTIDCEMFNSLTILLELMLDQTCNFAKYKFVQNFDGKCPLLQLSGRCKEQVRMVKRILKR